MTVDDVGDELDPHAASASAATAISPTGLVIRTRADIWLTE
jgi:hypothetical protein